ncbi:alpha/beta hydrolase [Nocardia sp. CDC160]|uniref:alpha/beta hydrolase n=1 Tax=Nocardia sp. CDC160 TaxID=3112166 RepID=UPI002DBC3C3E|nr:alpha/beta hydrolase family protein [Nocardia sp. CDC160]MEC3917498.1 alpha/beta hydrolase family protein [Nocardia sp. CDC160]
MLRTGLATVLISLTPTLIPVAHAESAHLDRIERVSDHELTIYVYSAAMDRVIPQDVLIPDGGSAGRPIAYLLFGATLDDEDTVWQTKTDLLTFAPGTGITIVIPHGGGSTYYTDWQQDDPVLGRNKWKTFLTAELPPIIDAVLHPSGSNALVGLSMSGTSALALTEAAPDLYEAVGAFSSCPETSTPLGRSYVYLTTHVHGGGNVENMWGPIGSSAWTDNDPYLHAELLRGHTIYLSSGNGLPGRHDNLAEAGSADVLQNQIIEGGAIEAATGQCTLRLATRLAELGIPATYRPHQGTHSWGYWQDDLHDFWPIMAAAIGA